MNTARSDRTARAASRRLHEPSPPWRPLSAAIVDPACSRARCSPHRETSGLTADCWTSGKTGKLAELKTAHSRRVVEMPGALVSVLRAHKLASAYVNLDDLVLASRTGGRLEQRNVAQRGLYRACKAAGIPERWPTFHELRHAHASAPIAADTDLVEVSARLRHGDPSITASTYSHEFEAAAVEVNRAQSEPTPQADNLVDLQATRNTTR